MTIEKVSRGYVYRSIAKKWDASRQKMWYEFKDPLKTKDEIMDNVPVGITRDQWTSFVNYRYKEETQNMCKRNAENWKNQTVPHTGGFEPNFRRRAEMGVSLDEHNFILLHIRNKMDHMQMRRQKKCPSDAASGPVSPTDARRSSGASNSANPCDHRDSF
ncbi:PREDICTED: uncharacterized protein LOC109241795 isoform X2 [Nicotiana attenuata]|nr:PREDICTED: uncharacterized protein LOC109241795 isoform X2 [Nicotiana attenuata]